MIKNTRYLLITGIFYLAYYIVIFYLDFFIEQKLQELTEQRRHLTSDLEAAVHDMQNICLHASERTAFVQSIGK